MFIHNFTNDTLRYDSKGNVIKLKPNTVTFVDDSLVKPEKLKECFGSRIDIRKDLDIIGHINGLGNIEDSIEEITVSVEVKEPKEDSHDIEKEGNEEEGNEEDSHDVEKEGNEEDSEAQGPKPDNAEEPKEENKTTKKATSKGGKKGKPNKKKN